MTKQGTVFTNFLERKVRQVFMGAMVVDSAPIMENLPKFENESDF